MESFRQAADGEEGSSKDEVGVNSQREGATGIF